MTKSTLIIPTTAAEHIDTLRCVKCNNPTIFSCKGCNRPLCSECGITTSLIGWTCKSGDKDSICLDLFDRISRD